MPLSQSGLGLKAYRDYDEHDVINGVYAAQTVPLPQALFVTAVTVSGFPNVNTTGTGFAPSGSFISPLSPYGFPPAYVSSLFFGIKNNLVRPANSGEVVLGMNLHTCAEYDKYGESYARNLRRKYADQIVMSGEGLKLVTKGIFVTNAFSGTPTANQGAYVSGGYLIPCTYNKTLFPGLVGKFLTGPDQDGYADFKIEL
jgi:hypothetical protein